jgi:hypothetical protein
MANIRRSLGFITCNFHNVEDLLRFVDICKHFSQRKIQKNFIMKIFGRKIRFKSKEKSLKLN